MMSVGFLCERCVGNDECGVPCERCVGNDEFML